MSLPVSNHSPLPASAGGSDTPETAASREARQRRLEREKLIDDELAQSFPASDPPSWVQSVAPRPT